MGPCGAGGFLGGGCRWREGHLCLFSLHDRTYVYGHMYVAIYIYMQFVRDCLVARLDFDLGDSIQFNARGNMFCVQNRHLVRASCFPQSPQVCEIHSLYNINKLFYFWHLNSTFHVLFNLVSALIFKQELWYVTRVRAPGGSSEAAVEAREAIPFPFGFPVPVAVEIREKREKSSALFLSTFISKNKWDTTCASNNRIFFLS